MSRFSLLDIAPTAARALGIILPECDGHVINLVESWGCRNVVLMIVDSLGYYLYKWLEPRLRHMPRLVRVGFLLQAESVSCHTTPAIASILSGLLPEHHGIFDKEGAKESEILSLPEIASASGLKSAVVMEKNGAEVYQGLIDIVGAVSDAIPSQEFDNEICLISQEALGEGPRLLVSYFIGIDKAVHAGQGPDGIKEAACSIDRCIGKLAEMLGEDTLMIICGDHPVHAGSLKREEAPYTVALILSRGGSDLST
jgi:predicted AlkP superfamily pyrophosphatase or phosphodiesterase